MTKESNKANDGWITLAHAVELIRNLIYPKDDRRSASNKVRQRIGYAIKKAQIERKYDADQPYLVMQHFQFWAIRSWPELKHREEFSLPETSLVDLSDKLEMVLLPPSVDRASVDIPDGYNELKKLHLSTLQKLMTSEWHLASCRAELTEVNKHDAELREKRSVAGKKGKGVPRRPRDN